MDYTILSLADVRAGLDSLAREVQAAFGTLDAPSITLQVAGFLCGTFVLPWAVALPRLLVFSKAATKVACNVCGATLAEPQGGYAKLNGEITAELA